MNIRALALALAVAAATALARASPASARMVRRRPEFSVLATLVDRGPGAPHCGVLHVVVPMRFRVDAASRSLVPTDEVTVAVSCPELSPVPLTVGSRYALTVTPERQPGAIVWGRGPRPARHWWLVRASESP